MTRRNPRRERFEDRRPDWRDPNMPVTRDYVFADGSKVTSVDPEYERRLHEHHMRIPNVPHFSADPTYNLRKK